MSHRRIGHCSRKCAIGHHSQEIEVFDANHPTGARQLSREFVLHIPAHVGDLLMRAGHLQPLLLIVRAEPGSLRFGVFGFLFPTKLALQRALVF